MCCSRACAEQLGAERLRKCQLDYVPCELGALSALNALFDTTFKKELVAGRYFDFADSERLIEHTVDIGKGIGAATARFAAAIDDKREKILYANVKHLGAKRLGRLSSLGVTVRDYRELERTP